MSTTLSSRVSSAIAIVGMAGRFPGAPNLEDFWVNLRDGVESIVSFSEEEMEESNDNERARGTRYVRAKGILSDVEQFDAVFFGFTPREAELTDPQQRLFLECAWQALENAGYDTHRFGGAIGVFGGASFNQYLYANLLSNRGLIDSIGMLQTSIRNRTDHLTTNVAYKLDLKGPAVTVQTACSTSLVAVHLAVQSLLNGECDLALAGGSSISLPQKSGYVYQEGGILSPDGHCRAFDSHAEGTVTGNGVGIVVLKRLDEAVADRDNIQAVILGSAIGNDGAMKVGYTAPSIDGQAQVIAEAQMVAGVSPESVSYIEAHGTGTKMGDPIEITALTQVFREQTRKTEFCGIGSVKTNIGHLDTAAGVAGLIKTVLSLKHRQLPPSLHFSQSNPEIDFTASPFFVNAKLRTWDAPEPRRAGVSSFGIGGTNAHLVVEEAPVVTSDHVTRSHQLLLLSARTSTALEIATASLAAHLEEHHDDIALADVAHTLQAGRAELSHRRVVICRDQADAIVALRSLNPHQTITGFVEPKTRPITFMFPGQGAQYVNMAAGLYREEPIFRKEVDESAELLHSHLGFDLRQVLYPVDQSAIADNSARLKQTEVTQPALFVIEYATARLLLDWGLKPEAMIGHSIGEYVAACLAGVFSREDALSLVAARARLMQNLPGGGMLVIPLSEGEVCPMLSEGLALAAVNGPASCVVSGSHEKIEPFEQRLIAKTIACRRLPTSHAFHSPMMEPMLCAYREVCSRVRFHAPRLAYISNLSGTWIKETEATDPNYWVSHLRQTVRFGDGVRELVKDSDRVLLEVGPGRTLSTLARWNPYRSSGQVVLNSIRHPEDRVDDEAFLLTTMGKLWMAGVGFDWSGFYKNEKRKRVSLPSYPFERQRYWIEPGKTAHRGDTVTDEHQKLDISEWLYAPVWKTSVVPKSPKSKGENASALIFSDQFDLGMHMADQLKNRGFDVVVALESSHFSHANDDSFTIRSNSSEDYQSMFRVLQGSGRFPRKIVYLWTLADPHGNVETLKEVLDRSFFAPLLIGQAIGALSKVPPVEILFVSNYLYDVTGAVLVRPERATLLGPCHVIAQEYPGITTRHVDIDLVPGETPTKVALSLAMDEVESGSQDKIVAHRGGRRWVQSFDHLPLEMAQQPVSFKEGGTYLITGGLGGLGLVFAEQLVETANANLVLVGRSVLPERESWEEWLENHDVSDPTSSKIRKLQSLESKGARIFAASADVQDESRMREIIRQANEKFGSIHGVIHAAGIPGGGIIERKTREMAGEVLGPKVKGTLVLASVFRDSPLDFFVLCSSRSSILGGFGQVDYCAANAFLDVFAQYSRSSGRTGVVSVNWDAWQDVGMLVKKAAHLGIEGGITEREEKFGHPLLDFRVGVSEKREVFKTTFSPLTHWVLDEHRIVGNAVIPGVAYLEMARAITQRDAGDAMLEIRDAFFLAPLGLRDDEKREVKIIVDREGSDRTFRVISKPNEDMGEQGWHEYATGRVAFVPPSPGLTHDLRAIAERCNLRRVILTDDSKRDEDLGPRWQALKHAWIGKNELLAFLELPVQFAPELDALKLHPSLMDRATGTGKEFLVGEGVYLPMGYRRVRLRRPLERKIYVHIRFREQEDTRRQTITFDIIFMNEQGEELVEIEAFSQKRVNDVTAQIKVFANRYHKGDEASTRRQEGAERGSLAALYSAELQRGITPRDGKEIFLRILSMQEHAQIVVSTKELRVAIAEATKNKPLTAILETTSHSTGPEGMHPRPEIETPFAPANNEFEKSIAAVWQNILGIEKVGIHDNFFELGGDSVQAIQIIAQMNERGFQLTPQQLFQHLTIAELATAITTSETPVTEQEKTTFITSAPFGSEDRSEVTPSDFSLAGLDEQELRDLELTLAQADHQLSDIANGQPGTFQNSVVLDISRSGNRGGISAQLEETLRQHPAVSQVLIAETHNAPDETTAYVVLRPAYSTSAERPMQFGLFYFGDDNSISGSDKYRLYLEGAKFADRHGFSSVWTPERHFHRKGGLYPNPSVLNAALAIATERVQLRAGSVVMPLHNSLRVAEEWSIVDNLSRGRVGIAFVSGWVANDFAFFPERFAHKRDEMFKGIAEVQRLWRGEKIDTRDGAGNMTQIEIFPKPIQRELPISLTCSGGREMFVKAGELGFGILTSLQEQSTDEVAAKIKAYQEARTAAGFDPATGQVTMMIHTFMGSDKDTVLQKVRGPLSNYLRSHVDLIKSSGAHKAEFGNNASNAELVDSLVAFAFERYYRNSSLIGTPESCLPMIERLKSIGVNEVACLIDFGVDVESSLESLRSVNLLRQLCGTANISDRHASLQEDLMVFLRGKLSAAAIPNSLLIVDELPVEEHWSGVA